MIDAARVLDRARSLGFVLAGVAAPDPTEHLPRYRTWLDRGFHGDMTYLGRGDAVKRRGDLRQTMEHVRSVVVVAHPYGASSDPVWPEAPEASRGIIARYARGADYHRVVKRRLERLLRWLESESDGPVSGRVYVDTGPILERDLARRAGLGWFGRNTMLIHPRRGSYLLLGLLLLDTELEPSAPFEDDHCGSCRACLDACPTGALLGRDEQGAPVMDARRCISYLTIELRGPIPKELRTLVGNRVFGCDICQEVCPFTRRFAAEAGDPAYAARGPGERPAGVEPLPGERSPASHEALHPGTSTPALVELMAMDEVAWEAFSRASPIRRAGRAGFLRNVAVALGNWGSEEAVPALATALTDAEPLVRGHAAWALGRIGAEAATAAMALRLEVEDDSYVLEEIRSAIADASPQPESL